MASRPPVEIPEARIAKALAHPLRARILERLGEREASPGELADALGEPLGVVSYHVRMLREYHCVELVRTVPRRGALQHFYRATARPRLDHEQWRNLPAALRGELADGTIGAIVEDLTRAADAGTLADGETVLSRVPLELDARGRQKLHRLLARTLEQVDAIAAESATRAAEGGEERVPIELALLHFKRADPGTG
jgi:DNA-binding transcriptional ArsR family regulator